MASWVRQIMIISAEKGSNSIYIYKTGNRLTDLKNELLVTRREG